MQSLHPTNSYEITEDLKFFNELYNITPEVQKRLPELQEKAGKGKTSAIPTFKKLIQKYPKDPLLKNLFAGLYANSGNQKKALELSRKLMAEHPDYLLGKLHLAGLRYQQEDFEGMREVMGESMELSELYPDRKTFFIGEVVSYYKLAFSYFVSVDDLDQAKLRLQVMQDIAPDNPDTQHAEDLLDTFLMIEDAERELEKRIKPDVPPKSLPPQHQRPPRLHHTEVLNLYSTGWEITDEELEKILQLPRESLIADLKALLVDAVERFQYFQSLEGNRELDYNFPVHAIIILGEIEAEESLAFLLDFLRYNDDVLDFWMDDTLTELVWQSLYKTGQNQLEVLRDFLLEPGPELFSKTNASVALSHIAYLQPHRREEVLQHYRILFERIASATPQDNIIDSEVNDFIISDLIEINAIELLPEIKKLFDLNYVDSFACGEYEDVQEDLQNDMNVTTTLYSLKEQYAWLRDFYAPVEHDTVEHDTEDDEDDYLFPEAFPQPVVKPKKVGRNDPCPCGSGKKYKKCCG